MTEETRKSAFAERLDALRSAIRRAQMWYGVSWVLLVAVCGLAALAMADYRLELPWLVRAAGLGGLGCVMIVVAVRQILSPWLWWSRLRPLVGGPLRTAVEIEQRFPQLGQRARTVVQFSGRADNDVVAEGVAPPLIAALEKDADLQAQPLDLSVVVPRRKLQLAAAAAAVSVVLLLCAVWWNWEYRLAVCRALLDDQPYTQIAITPGDFLVDEGQDVSVSVEITGRARENIVVYTRPAGNEVRRPEVAAKASWSQRELTSEDAQPRGERAVAYQTALEDLHEPIEYWATADHLRSSVHRITVRYPVVIKKFEATLTPPAYTGLEENTVEGGDLDVVEGTNVRFQIQLDRPCAEAALVLSDPPYATKKEPTEETPRKIPLQVGSAGLEADFEFREDKLYSIVARARDGTELAENQHRVRVRKDQPPRVHFEDPDEALEVHPLAEVLMRIRTGDDFGLSKTGIVFQIDDDPEQTLLVENVSAATASETTRAVCEKIFQLEDFELTPTQSVTYYAFAEDNFPDHPKRTETDLRFIDIREFMRLYKVGGS